MNTGGRKKRDTHDIDMDYQLIGQLIDESKFLTVINSTNKWDRTMKMASHLTSRYVEELQTYDTSFCKQNDFICDIFLYSSTKDAIHS